MLIHKPLGRHAPKPKAPRPVQHSGTLKCYAESSFGVVLKEEIPIQFTTQDEFLAIVGRALRLDGVNMLRYGTTEYRLDGWARISTADMWSRIS